MKWKIFNKQQKDKTYIDFSNAFEKKYYLESYFDNLNGKYKMVNVKEISIDDETYQEYVGDYIATFKCMITGNEIKEVLLKNCWNNYYKFWQEIVFNTK